MPTVIQRSDSTFEMGKKAHNHPAPIGAMVATRIKCLVKQEASNDVFKPASEVVTDILLNELTDAPCPSLPCLDSLQRTGNRFRQRLWPQDPKDVEFYLEMEHVPDKFFREDVKIRGRRHLIFASDKKLAILSQSKT